MNFVSKINPTLEPIVREVSLVAEEMGYPLFLVGGMVRDLILKKENLDLDFVVEGSGVVLAQKMAKIWGGAFKVYYKFKTATVELNGHRIDFATAREEVYPHPGSYPKVRPSSLKEDLRRRDFTINAMAVSLNKGKDGELIDLYGGMKDLQEGSVRVLHDLSFIDDPTRIFRAVRFEQRLGFQIEKNTLKLIQSAISDGALKTVSSYRLKKEKEKILQESDPEACFNRLRQWHRFGIMSGF